MLFFLPCVALLQLATGRFSCFVLFVDFLMRLVAPSGIVMTVPGGEGAGCFFFPLVCNLCSACFGLFAFPLSVIGRLWSLIVVLPGHLPYYLYCPIYHKGPFILLWLS